ncbi:MAG: hypothetical protein JJT76_05260 [Clostridiaceae bacterium]|nr:hypothetical protein [Clostridiaceae bacterium]
MKKFSIHSMALGIGVGMILTAILNIFFNTGLTEAKNYTTTDQFITLPEMKTNYDIEKIEQNFDDIHKNQEHITINIERGMNTGDIAVLLQKEGLISNSNDFLKTADRMEATNKMRFGEKKIPNNSTLEDIVKILIQIE